MPQLNWSIINDSYKNGIIHKNRTDQQNNEEKTVSERKVGTKDENAPHQAAGETKIEKSEAQQRAVSVVAAAAKMDVE